ncbi:MAG: M15 family metallopeptidase, partial [Gemmatimonadaceae bacterium]|nr:M15 family metallopeptidase [Gemmatimonadaceae bacterium]
MSGFGLVASATTPPAAPARGDVGGAPSSGSGDAGTASQFAAMLVALLGGTPSDAQASDRDALRSLPARPEAESDEADGGLVDDTWQPMSPIGTSPELMQPIAIAPEVPLPFPIASVAAAPGVTAAERSLEGLSPDFRARLERVIERMRTDHGHDVQLVETTRSPERQAWLYAQGRTRPGQVVTWTQHSAHLSGDAADVIIDGQWRNDRAYGRLHRIAEDEGLRTLGARDPGHLELPAGLRAARAQLAERAMPTLPEQASSVAQQQMITVAAQHAARAAAKGTRSRGAKSDGATLPGVDGASALQGVD